MLSEDGNNILDSAAISKGEFIMQGKIGLPERRLFIISPGTWSFKAFVEDRDISLFIDTSGAQHFGKPGNTWALIWEVQETGSKLSDVYSNFRSETSLKYYAAIFDSLNQRIKKAYGDETDKIKAEMDSINRVATAKQKSWIDNYINQHPSSIAGLYIFNEFYQLNPGLDLLYLQTTINKFSGIAKSSVYYKQLTDAVNQLKGIQQDNIATDFTLLNNNKVKFTLSSTRGYYTIIDFWASWCIPCRKSIPAWKKVYATYYDNGLRMVSVSSDANYSDWIKALNHEQMPWIQLIDKYFNENEPAKVSGLYAVSRLPFYILLGEDGKIILNSNDEKIVIKKIEEIFKE